MQKISIKNMVCDQCVKTVARIVSQNKLKVRHIELGKVVLEDEVSPELLTKISAELAEEGFEILDSTTPVIVNEIKSSLIELFQEEQISEDFKLSAFLTARLHYDYAHLSRIFSQHHKDTLEHYFIKLRIEKAKELLSYKDMNVSEVAFTLGYSNIAHFSRQFKKWSGVSPSSYRLDPGERISLSEI